ncbi:hypothetical protein RvY_15168 [Ramazzottius varieornatus]|uniref:F-box domain-containing protein n=1 Tax=Ramazzottius varieornatus TaxID=947166 RepID=A0A1D1VVA9_RAMVA|nr:hypothetical protein RvY_15168 [Ramazzottius varieornatus]
MTVTKTLAESYVVDEADACSGKRFCSGLHSAKKVTAETTPHTGQKPESVVTLTDLPPLLLREIFQHMHLYQRLYYRTVCKDWKDLLDSRSLREKHALALLPIAVGSSVGTRDYACEMSKDCGRPWCRSLWHATEMVWLVDQVYMLNERENHQKELTELKTEVEKFVSCYEYMAFSGRLDEMLTKHVDPPKTTSVPCKIVAENHESFVV